MLFITFLSVVGGFLDPFGNHLGNIFAHIFQHFFKSHLNTTKWSKMTSKSEGAFTLVGLPLPPLTLSPLAYFP